MRFNLYFDDYYALRKYLIDSGFYAFYTSYKRYCWFLDMFEKGLIEEIPSSIAVASDYYYIICDYESYIDTCRRMFEARRSKVKRIKHRLSLMFKYCKCKNFLFLTLTWRDEVFDTTSSKTRRTYVSRFLKSCSDSYVANIDYGKINEREHYHAIVGVDRVDWHEWFDKYGAINFEVVPKLNEDCLQLAKYINKITNHAVKSTSGSAIYSRNLRSFEELAKKDKDDYLNFIASCDIIEDDSDFPF